MEIPTLRGHSTVLQRHRIVQWKRILPIPLPAQAVRQLVTGPHLVRADGVQTCHRLGLRKLSS